MMEPESEIIERAFAEFNRLGYVDKLNEINTGPYAMEDAVYFSFLLGLQSVYRPGRKLTPHDFEEIYYTAKESIDDFIASEKFAAQGDAKHGEKTEPITFSKFDLPKKHSNLNESELSKSDVEKIVRDILKKEVDKKDYLSKNDIKELIRKTIVNQYKVLWQKSSFYVNQI